MTNSQFEKLFQYMQDMKSELKTDIARVDSKFDPILRILDIHTKQITENHQEILMLGNKLDRHSEESNQQFITIDQRFDEVDSQLTLLENSEAKT